MKKLTTLLFTLCTLISVAQTAFISSRSFDTLLFRKINDYRAFYKFTPIKWNEEAYKMAQHHTAYQIKTLTVTHIESDTASGMLNMEMLTDRGSHYLTKVDAACNENVEGGRYLIPLDSTTTFSKFVEKIWHKKLNSLAAEEIMALRVLFIWDGSATHKPNLLSTSCTRGAISSQFKDVKKTANSIWLKGKPALEFAIYSTMNFIE